MTVLRTTSRRKFSDRSIVQLTLVRFREFTRQPDDFLGLLGLGLSMGQWLSLPMILAGIAMMLWAHRFSGAAGP